MVPSQGWFARYGPWAIVTGASSGIGEQFARLLAAEGFDLVVVARRKDRLVALAHELREAHAVEVLAVPLDLSSPHALETLGEVCAGKEVGLLVSNAGMGLKGEHCAQDPDVLTQLLFTNCLAPLQLTRAFVPEMVRRGRGGVILTGSMEGYLGFPYSTAYAATKNFVHALGEGLWGELHGTGVDVVVLAPGPTDTEILRRSGADPKSMIGLQSPRQVAQFGLERLGSGPVRMPGVLNRIFVRFLLLLPRRWALRLAGEGMRRVTAKR